jgi:hypothetical protein
MSSPSLVLMVSQGNMMGRILFLQGISMVDYVGDPTHYCQEHGEWYYFHCRKCFDPHGDEPLPVRVKPVQGEVEGQSGKKRRRRRK